MMHLQGAAWEMQDGVDGSSYENDERAITQHDTNTDKDGVLSCKTLLQRLRIQSSKICPA